MSGFSISMLQVWLAIGIVLIGLEVTSMTFFLLWPAIAAFAVAIVVWIFPEFALIGQLLLFAIISTSLLIPGRKLVLPFLRKNPENLLNNKMSSMIGQRVSVVGIDGDMLRVKFGDSEWSAQSLDQFSIGDIAKISDTSGNVLIISAT